MWKALKAVSVAFIGIIRTTSTWITRIFAMLVLNLWYHHQFDPDQDFYELKSVAFNDIAR
jgi:hypothetical protein